MRSLTLKADAGPLLDCLSELDVAELPLEVIQRFLILLERPEQIASVKIGASSAGRTDEMVVRFDPSDRLYGLAAAVSARQVKSLVIKETSHQTLPCRRPGAS